MAMAFCFNMLVELISNEKDIYENLPLPEVRLVNEFAKLNVRKTRGKESGNVCKAVQDIREEALAEGEARGRAEGEAKGESLFAKLVSFLLANDKINELEEATKSPEKRKAMYSMYNITL